MKKQLLALTICFVSFLGCQKEDIYIKEDPSQSRTVITKVSNEFIENDKQLSSTLESFSSNTNDSASRLVFNVQYNFVIDTDSAILIEDGDYHSYTFALYSEDTSVTENLLLSYNTENDNYTAYKTTYNLTYEERLNTINGVYENQISESLIQTELLDIDATGLLNRTGGVYYLGDGLCGTFDHVSIDPENSDKIILHFVNVHSCDNNNSDPVIFDVPDSGGGFSFVSINFYNSSTGATEEWDANDWAAVNGGSFSSGNGQVTYFPITNTIPFSTKQQEILNILDISVFNDPEHQAIAEWVYTNDNAFEVSEFYDYLIDNTNKFGTDQEVLDITFEILSFATERDWKEELRLALANGITSTSEVTHSIYSKLSDIAQEYPSSIYYINVIVNELRSVAEEVVDTNPQTLSWQDLFGIWLLELGQYPANIVNFGDDDFTTDSLKQQEGVNEARQLALDKINNNDLSDPTISHPWIYGQGEFYDGMQDGNIATSFLGSYSTNIVIIGNQDGSFTLQFSVTNYSTWDSATRLRIDNDNDGNHDGIFDNTDRNDSNTINLGGTIEQNWNWTENL
jgi:hypothetical protein